MKLFCVDSNGLRILRESFRANPPESARIHNESAVNPQPPIHPNPPNPCVYSTRIGFGFGFGLQDGYTERLSKGPRRLGEIVAAVIADCAKAYQARIQLGIEPPDPPAEAAE